MTRKLMLYGIKERSKVYVGIALLYLLYVVVSNVYKPTPRMDRIVDWVGWSYELLGVKIYAGSFVLLGMAAAALLVAEIIIFARDLYSRQAYLLFSLPVNGKHVVGSRFGLFILDFLLLFALDLPIRLPFYQTLLSSARSGEIEGFSPWLTTSDALYLGILAGVTWILLFTILPLLTYLLIAAAKCLFDLSVGWLTAFLALGFGVFLGLFYVLSLAMPPLIHGPLGATYNTNPFIPILLLIANLLIFWSGTRVIDRKLNI